MKCQAAVLRGVGKNWEIREIMEHPGFDAHLVSCDRDSPI